MPTWWMMYDMVYDSLTLIYCINLKNHKRKTKWALTLMLQQTQAKKLERNILKKRAFFMLKGVSQSRMEVLWILVLSVWKVMWKIQIKFFYQFLNLENFLGFFWVLRFRFPYLGLQFRFFKFVNCGFFNFRFLQF